MDEAWGREILCSPRCPSTVTSLPLATSPTSAEQPARSQVTPALLPMPHFTVWGAGRKPQTRACSSRSAWLASFELTGCMAWDVKPLLEGQPAVIYQTRGVVFPLQSEHSEHLHKHLGQGCFLHVSLLSLHVTAVLVQGSTPNFSEFPECWFVFPHP